jgi:N-methylhydantoinase A
MRTTWQEPARGSKVRRMGVIIGVDTGGTFTDLVAADAETGEIAIHKLPSTPSDPATAVLDGIAAVMASAGLGADDVAMIAHGTTVATNAILENKGARAALVTTAGFRYVLDLGRQDVPRGVNLYRWQKPQRPVTPDLVFEVRERIGPDGTVRVPLDEAGVRSVAARIRAAGVIAVGVSTLHSYANPEHEQRIGAILTEELPGVHLTLSSDVLPAFREYERTMVTAMNAAVMPLMSGYIRRISRGLDAAGIAAPFLIMKSNGGVAGAETIAAQPVYTALSGLAAGVQGACLVGLSAGFPNLISLDIGGTSTDVAICPSGEPVLTPETEIGALPLKIQSVDVRTIGAGGGSIAEILANGSLIVGPESAAADPGPACYGRGGTRPTVTDAQVVLGRLPTGLADGRLVLDRALAAAAIETAIARPLGLSLEQAASGIIEILTHNIAGAVRGISIERGHDPSRYALIAGGGAGPLHALRLAEILRMKTVVFPRYPGVLSALGLLATPLRQDYVRTCRQVGPNFDTAALTRQLDGLAATAEAWFDRERMPAERRAITRYLDVRYPNQGHELQMAVPPDRDLGPDVLDEMTRAFHDRHEQLYGFALRSAPVQIESVRVAAVGRFRTLAAPPAATTRSTDARPSGERSVYVDDQRGFRACPIYVRGDLSLGATIDGPAIVDQADSTIFLRSGWRAVADAAGNLVATYRGDAP